MFGAGEPLGLAEWITDYTYLVSVKFENGYQVWVLEITKSKSKVRKDPHGQPPG